MSSGLKHWVVKKSFQPVARLSWTNRVFWSIWGKPQGFWPEAVWQRQYRAAGLLCYCYPTSIDVERIPVPGSSLLRLLCLCWSKCQLTEGQQHLTSVSETVSHHSKGRLVPRKGSPDATSCTVLATSCALWQFTMGRKREEIPLNVGDQAFRNEERWSEIPVNFLFLKLISNADF